ncbi:MAG: NAD-dependent epimerase/dehydratase family protein [Candidatus Heimdallarchaeaceae archaeon]
MKVIITGIDGFLGYNLYKRIKSLQKDWEILGLDIKNNNKIPNLIKTDLTSDSFQWSELINEYEPGYIFHIAGIIRTENRRLMYDLNTRSALSILEGVRKTEINPRVLIVGSAAQYGTVPLEENPVKETYNSYPDNFYGLSKMMQENLALLYHRNYGLDVICTRPSNIIGRGLPNNFLPGLLTEVFTSNKYSNVLKLKSLNDVRDYIDVIDVCYAFIELMKNRNTKGEIFNVSSGIGVSNIELFNLFSKVSGKQIELQSDNSDKKPLKISLSNQKLKRYINFEKTMSLKESIRNCLEDS